MTSLDSGAGRGRVNFTGSTIDMQNGVAGDVLRVSRARFDASTLALDVDLADELSDRIDANAVIIEGRNTLALEMLDDAVPSGTRLFAILPVDGEIRPLPGGAPDDAFVVDALDFPLVGRVLTGSQGGLYLEVAPDIEVLVAGEPTAPSNASTAAAFLTTIDDFSSQTLNYFLDQASVSRTGGQISETFGVFAVGRAGYLDHDGFEVSGPGGTEAGAPFTANDFSLIGSVEVDVAKWRDLPDYLLKVGLFGGYASTDVDVDGTTVAGVPLRGSSGENDSGMFGGYVILAKGQTYGLASLTGFWGKTDVTNDDLDSDGSYDTSGYGLTLTAGRQTPLNERYTLDLRGSVGYLSFTGDGFTDNQGFEYGDSEVSFGYVKLQPGISAAVPFRDQTLRPYLRAELAQRIDYQNTSTFQGEEFSFQDNDFSAAAMLGTDYAVRGNLTLSGEIAGYTSGDFNAVTAKIGLKYLF
jgi:opacity protein-like surface antigen